MKGWGLLSRPLSTVHDDEDNWESREILTGAERSLHRGVPLQTYVTRVLHVDRFVKAARDLSGEGLGSERARGGAFYVVGLVVLSLQKRESRVRT
jgi:hypothetical protein